MIMPDGLKTWTVDEVSECLSYGPHLPEGYGGWTVLSTKLWAFLAEAKNRTPMGGDGSNGTVETPDGRDSLENDDKMGSWWHKLDECEQAAISKAYDKL